MHVLLGARDQAKGSEAAKKLKSEGLDVEFIPLDVDDEKNAWASGKSHREEMRNAGCADNNVGIMLDEKRDG
jgi:short-subunit dehydrogenase